MSTRGVASDDERALVTSTFEAERRMTWFRLVIMASGTVLFPLVGYDQAAAIPWLAYTMLASGWVYSIALLAFEPYRRFPILLSARLTSSADLSLTLLWILATGGVASPWAVAIFPAIVMTSLRQRPLHTLVAALAGASGYLLIAAVLGQLASHTATLVVHVLFIVFAAVGAATVAQERLSRLKSRMRLLDLTQQVGQIGTWELTLHDRKLTWSDELYRLFGVERESFEPSRESFLSLIHPDDRVEVERSIDAALHEGTPFRNDHRIVTPDGRVRWMHCRGQVASRKGDAVRELVGFAQDVTETRELHGQVLLAAKLASVGTLASGVAHEINNPLAYAANNLAVLERELKELGPKLPPEALSKLSAAIASARHGTARVSNIVVGLRTFARRDDLQRSTVDLARVADLAIEIASHEITHRARLVREYGQAPQVVANESRLSQVLVNLLVNAAHAIERGAAADNEIRVRIYRDEGRACVEVSDTGSGVRPEHVERIFDPFFTTKKTGMGLGLALCDELLRDFGGRLELARTGPGGSTFRVSMPAARSRSEPRLSAQPEVPAAPTPGQKRLLVIDDEVRYAESMRLLLGYDHDVTVVTDADRALELLAEDDGFDVIFCDLMMPQKTGMDLYDELVERAPELCRRIVFLTGGATNARALELLGRPEVRHLHKPVALPALEALIAEMPRAAREEEDAPARRRASRLDQSMDSGTSSG